jgi:ribosomal protein S18 acetylase RimI-like enzyme
VSIELRPVRRADLPALAAIACRRQVAAQGSAEFGLARLETSYSLDGSEWWLAEDGGVPLGLCSLELDEVVLWAEPLPGDAAGAALLALLQARAAKRGIRELTGMVWAPDQAASERYERAGWRPDGEVLRMERVLGPARTPPRWPPDVSVRSLRGDDVAAVHALLEAAFAANRETIPPYRLWAARFTADPGFDAESCFLAEAGSVLVGVALCWGEGFVKDLAVHPEWRRRGIGEALLLHAFAVFAARGASSVGLKVDADNPTGALRLYERVGMRPVRRYELWSKTVTFALTAARASRHDPVGAS